MREAPRNTPSMKQAFRALLLTSIFFPTQAPAQQPFPLPLPPPHAATASFPQTRPQIEQINRRTRERMLAALTLPHRAFLARLAGDLITAQTPDIPAAVRLLNATLAPAETQSIIRAQNDEFAEVQRLMRATLGETRPGTRRTEEHLRRVREIDAGRALLHSALLIGSYERR
jgi:hypothetical protein